MHEPNLYNNIGGCIGILMMVYHIFCVLGYLYYSMQVQYPAAQDFKLFGIFPNTLIMREVDDSWGAVTIINAVLTPVWFLLMFWLWLPFILTVPLGIAVVTARQKKFG